MWMECSPGGRFLTSSVILTPFAVPESWAVPTLWPSVFLNSTVTGLEAERLRESWALIAEVRAKSRHTPHTIALIGITSFSKYSQRVSGHCAEQCLTTLTRLAERIFRTVAGVVFI